jgi:hypothetical protein
VKKNPNQKLQRKKMLKPKKSKIPTVRLTKILIKMLIKLLTIIIILAINPLSRSLKNQSNLLPLRDRIIKDLVRKVKINLPKSMKLKLCKNNMKKRWLNKKLINR